MKLTTKLFKTPHRTLFSILCMLTLISPTLHAEPITLRIHHFLGAESLPHTSLIEPWARRVEKASENRIKVEIHPAMTLGGKADELVDQVQSGAVDIVWTAAAYTPGRFPRSEVFTLPLIHSGDPAVTNLAIRELLGNELKDDFPGLRPLLVHVDQGNAFHLSSRPVTDLASFSGLTLRPPGRGVGSWTIEALGAENTKKRHPKLPKAMADGDLDGALMSFNLAESMGVIEASKSHTLLGDGELFGTNLFLFLMNEKRYRSLPEDLRRVIDENSGRDFARAIGQAWLQAGNAGIAIAEKRGNGIHRLHGAERDKARERLTRVSDLWLQELRQQGMDGGPLLGKARQTMDEQLKQSKFE